MEGRIALAHLLNRFPNLRTHAAHLQRRWRANMILRGLEQFPIKLN
jgi:cytochrome P450